MAEYETILTERRGDVLVSRSTGPTGSTPRRPQMADEIGAALCGPGRRARGADHGGGAGLLFGRGSAGARQPVERPAARRRYRR